MAAILDALARLETSITCDLLCATGAQCTPQNNSQLDLFGCGFSTSIILIFLQSRVPRESLFFQLKSSNITEHEVCIVCSCVVHVVRHVDMAAGVGFCDLELC